MARMLTSISESGWYKWVMFFDAPTQFLDSKMVLDRYLGPSVDAGLAMMAKIMISNGYAVHRLTL